MWKDNPAIGIVTHVSADKIKNYKLRITELLGKNYVLDTEMMGGIDSESLCLLYTFTE